MISIGHVPRKRACAALLAMVCILVFPTKSFSQSDTCKADGSCSRILIKGGTVVNAHGQEKADVLIVDGKIQAVGLDIEDADAQIVEASGKFVMPGGIDPHTHLEMPFMGQEAIDDFFSGQAAALAGGTTMHIDFALPINGDMRKGYENYVQKSKKACMDYAFHMAVTKWDDEVSKDMEWIVNEAGINSFKFFMAYKGALMVTDDQLSQGMLRCKELGAVPMVHAENGDLVSLGQQRVFDSGITGPEGHYLSRPAVLETEATARAVRMAEFLGSPLYVVHVMSEGAMQEVVAANARGGRVIGEPIAPGLTLDQSNAWDSNFTRAAAYVMSPPIRSLERDGMALRRALAAGHLHLVGTDHAVFNTKQKSVGRDDFRVIPNGVNGIEERMHLVWDSMVNTGMMTPSDFVRVTSTQAAKVFNCFPQKGLIAAGSDADVIVLDPSVTHTISASTHHSRIDINVFEGFNIKGKVTSTISRGRLVWHDGKLNVAEGSGRYLPLKPFGPLYDGVDSRDAAAKAAQNAPVNRT